MVECEKTGRVFFNGTGGNITELKFADYKNRLAGFLMYGDRRKMEKHDHQAENFISKLIPAVLKMRY